LLSGRSFVAAASRMSPLQASRRVDDSSMQTRGVNFGLFEFIALMLGGAKFIFWLSDWSLTYLSTAPWVADLDRALDFIPFPLFIYGLGAFIASRQKLMAVLMAPAAWIMAGPLKDVSLRHMATRRHRAAAFLLIVALMASLALYPTVMTAVFDNKTERGARIPL